MQDLDGDGKPELILWQRDGRCVSPSPIPRKPNGPWLSTQVGEAGRTTAHGIGAGDINGDGRVDIAQSYRLVGAAAAEGVMTRHLEVFTPRRSAAAAPRWRVYDVNGDGSNDVVTALQAHGFGLAWFEQKRDAAGTISFERAHDHRNFAAKNAGGVTFSEPHGSTVADIDRRRRSGLHRRQALLLAPRELPRSRSLRCRRCSTSIGRCVTRRRRAALSSCPSSCIIDPAPGSQVLAADLNKDGAVDLVTSTTQGAYVFFGTRTRKR